MSRLTRVIGKLSSAGTGVDGSYLVTRITPALPGDDGRLVQPTSETFPIVATEQPASGRDLQAIPDGWRGEETRNLYTTTPIRTVNQDGSPDYVTIGNKAWAAINIKRWLAFRGVHYIVLVTRRNVP